MITGLWLGHPCVARDQQCEAVAGAAGTVLFLVDAVASHVYASLGVARRLEVHGFRIEYCGAPGNQVQDLIAHAGFVYRNIEGLWSRYDDATRLPTQRTLRTLATHPGMVREKLVARRTRARAMPDALDRCERSIDALLAACAPAFIVVDPFLLAYYPLLWRRGVTCVALSTKPLPIADVLVPPYDSHLLAPRTVAGRIRVQLAWLRRRARDAGYRAGQRMATALAAYTYHDLLRAASARTGFPLEDELVRRWLQPDLHFRAVHEWALWLPETDLPRRAPLPPNVAYIGPCVDTSRRHTTREAWKRARSKHLIYVAVGTVRARWQDNLAFLRKAIAAFATLDEIEIVVSTGDARATAALGPPPPNTRVFDFVPQLDLLDAADLAVSHGGAGTFRECIECQVPMLVYPRNHDQMGNAARVVYHGIGLRGSRELDSAATIRRKALRLLSDPVFERNLHRLKRVSEGAEVEAFERALQRVVAAANDDTGCRRRADSESAPRRAGNGS